MRKVGLILLVATMALVSSARPALAIKAFYDVFTAEYIAEHEDREFAEFVTKKAKCYVCHQGRKSKKNHNLYGIHLVEPLDKKKDKKDVEKITKALKRAALLHSDPKDKKSPTYGELIAAGKLPGGELESLKKEPKKPKEPVKPQPEKKEPPTAG